MTSSWENLQRQKAERERKEAARRNSGKEPALTGNFTADEQARLIALRQDVRSHSVNINLGIDERRLRFARLLVVWGKLSEGTPDGKN